MIDENHEGTLMGNPLRGVRFSYPVVLLALVLGASFWVLDSVVDAYVFQESTLLVQLFKPGGVELWVRTFVLLLFLGFGLHVDAIMEKLKRAKAALRDSHGQLEQEVEERARSLHEELARRRQAEEALITARKGAEEQKAKAEAVIRGLGVGLIVQDLDYRVLYENSVQRETMGGHVGEHCYRAYADRDEICEDCPMALSLKDGDIHKAERRVPTPEGEKFFELTTSPLKDAEGKVTGGIKVVRDISERMRVVERSRQAQKSLEAILESTPYGVIIIDTDKTIVHANRAALSVLGYETPGDLVGEVCHGTLCPAESGKCPILDLGQEVDRSEKVLITRDGRHVPILKTVVPVALNGKSLLLEAFVDISDRREAEAFVENILESVDEAFLVIDRDYRIISANRAYCEQAKLTREAVIGEPCYRVSHGIETPCFKAGEECAVRHTFETGEPRTCVHEHHDSHGDVYYVETRSFPFRDSTGKVTSAIEIVNDVTERRRLEEQLRHSQKMEAIGTLTGGIAHEFNNIMTAILGFGDFLREELAPGSPQMEYATYVTESAERAARLTDGLLAYSRKQMTNMEPVSVTGALRSAERYLASLIGAEIEFAMDAGEDVTVMADRAQLEQVIMNLVTNARDAMPGGGTLQVRAEPVNLSEPLATEQVTIPPGSYACVSVSDTGEGMEKGLQEKVFEPFFTTKEVGKGTGLGLAIVYGIVKKHEGFITVESAPGEGTTFRVYLPVVAAPAMEAEPVHAVTSAAPEGSGTVLLAEDDVLVRRLIRQTLEKGGYTVIEAGDGEEAVRKYREHEDDIHLLLFDIAMPRRNGRSAYDEIHGLRPDLRVIFISGYSAEEIRGKGVLGEEHPLISKPLSPRELLTRVREAFD
jgi:two-component system NtrC family sensor kinase